MQATYPYKVTASPIHNTPLDTRHHCFRFTRLRKQQEKIDLSPNMAPKINSVQITSGNVQITSGNVKITFSNVQITSGNNKPQVLPKNPTSYRKMNKNKNRYSPIRLSFRFLTVKKNINDFMLKNCVYLDYDLYSIQI